MERLSEKQLLIKLETKFHIMMEEKAAITIQCMGRRLLSRNLFARMMSIRVKAAIRLQRAWRRRNNKTDILYLISLPDQSIQKHACYYYSEIHERLPCFKPIADAHTKGKAKT